MNNLFENFQENGCPHPLNKTIAYQPTNSISTYSLISTKSNINNSNNFSLSKNISMLNERPNYIYLISNENMSQRIQNQSIQDENVNIKVKNDKFKNNKKTSFDSSKENKNNKNLEALNKKEGNKNRSIIDSCSEVKKFKTELCHSWELTGTCKYGQNVIIFLYKKYFLLIYSVYLLMALLT